MNLQERVEEHFSQSIRLKQSVVTSLTQEIVRASELMGQTIRNGNKILSCGNGGSACDAQHFTAELVNRFQMERANLAAIALTADMAVITAIANDYNYNDIFANQIKALGQAGDLLFVLSTSGNSPNVIRAVQTAHAIAMPVLVLTGSSGGQLSPMLQADDIMVRVPSASVARIQEVHILIIHCLCDLLEQQLFGQQVGDVEK